MKSFLTSLLPYDWAAFTYGCAWLAWFMQNRTQVPPTVCNCMNPVGWFYTCKIQKVLHFIPKIWYFGKIWETHYVLFSFVLTLIKGSSRIINIIFCGRRRRRCMNADVVGRYGQGQHTTMTSRSHTQSPGHQGCFHFLPFSHVFANSAQIFSNREVKRE